MATLDSVSEGKSTAQVLRFRHAVRSDVGRHRTENQDSYAYVYARESGLFLVADGMGGARGGATASALAVDVIAREALDADGRISEDSLRHAIERANSVIFERSRTDEKLTGMGTTVVALAVSEDSALVAHVGDSRLYLLRHAKLLRLTRDHTLVQELIDSGAISPDQAENHPIAHMLTRSLGPVGAVDVETKLLSYPVEVGDRFLLCCDGLYNLVSDQEIEEILGSQEPEEAAEYLVALANERGGTDNITVEIVEIYAAEEGEGPYLPADQQEFFVSPNQSSDADNLDEAPHVHTDNGTYELKEEHVVAAETRPGSDDKIEPTSAYDSVIFGASPTAEDIKRHQERVKRMLEPPPPLEETVDEAPGEEEEIAEETARPQMQRLQVGALAVVVVALLASIYVVMPKGSGPATQVTTAVAPPAPKQDEEAPIDPQKMIATIEGEFREREALMAELESSSAPAESGLLPEATAGESGQGSAIDPEAAPPHNASSAPASATEAWPTADVVPEGTKLLIEQDGTNTAPEPEPKPSQPLFAEMPPPVPAVPAVDPTLARVIADASDLTVPAPPPVQIASDAAPTNQPIVWEHEKLRIARAAAAAEQNARTPAPRPSPSLLSETEKQKLVAEKSDLRERIANIDAKLQGFGMLTQEETKKRIDEIEDQLHLVESGLRQTTENLETAKRRYKVWQERTKLLKAKDPRELANAVSLTSVHVKRKKEAYEIASLRYLDAVELWRENPGNDQAASQMAAFGRELEARRIELTEAITDAVETALKQAQFDISEFALVKEDLERRRDRLNRHAGLAKVPPVTNAKGRMERQRELLDEREELSNRLKELRGTVSDQEEIEFRRSFALKRFGLN